MPALCDIHAHVLPGIDDGPERMEDTIAMARAAQSCGVTTLAATPHLRRDFPDAKVEEFAARCEQVRDALARERIDLQLVGGAETSLSWALEASDDQLRLASFGQQGKDLLIEPPFEAIVGLGELLHQIQRRGFRVTLAHPERNAGIRADPALLGDLVRQGVLLQVNASSLRPGRRRSDTQRLATQICREGLAHVVASDAHRAAGKRPVTALASALGPLSTLVGTAGAQWLTGDAPAAILAGERLPAPPSTRVSLGRRMLHGVSSIGRAR